MWSKAASDTILEKNSSTPEMVIVYNDNNHASLRL